MKQILAFQNVFSFLSLILNGGTLKRANSMKKKKTSKIIEKKKKLSTLQENLQ